MSFKDELLNTPIKNKDEIVRKYINYLVTAIIKEFKGKCIKAAEEGRRNIHFTSYSLFDILSFDRKLIGSDEYRMFHLDKKNLKLLKLELSSKLSSEEFDFIKVKVWCGYSSYDESWVARIEAEW